jgi:hypothetical protein
VSKSMTLRRKIGNLNIDAINALTELDRAWMAGFFDGEGSIGLYRKLKDGKFYAVTVRITIAQTDCTELEHFFAAFGGALVLINRPDRGTVRHTQYWSWTCDAIQNANVFLQTIRPWLRSKKDEADVLLEFVDNRHSYTLEQKGALIDKMALLKMRAKTHLQESVLDRFGELETIEIA